MNHAERKETAQRALVWIGIALYVLTPLVQEKAVFLPPAIFFVQVLLGVIVGGLGVATATPLAAAAMVAINMLYVDDVLGDKPSGT